IGDGERRLHTRPHQLVLFDVFVVREEGAFHATRCTHPPTSPQILLASSRRLAVTRKHQRLRRALLEFLLFLWSGEEGADERGL
ncbi:hypothetical protein PMAYCL1PPCAC_26723, partial [Pristionchus mayeri]